MCLECRVKAGQLAAYKETLHKRALARARILRWAESSAKGAVGGMKCPYGKPGDHLWVREMWKPRGVGQGCATTPAIYAAEYTFPNVVKAMRPWKPSIFMPRWASRITLEIVEVRVQRVQDIGEEDAQAEGVGPLRADGRMPYGVFASDEFADLWDSINMKRGFDWNVNPFVWAITFKWVTP